MPSIWSGIATSSRSLCATTPVLGALILAPGAGATIHNPFSGTSADTDYTVDLGYYPGTFSSWRPILVRISAQTAGHILSPNLKCIDIHFGSRSTVTRCVGWALCSVSRRCDSQIPCTASPGAALRICQRASFHEPTHRAFHARYRSRLRPRC